MCNALPFPRTLALAIALLAGLSGTHRATAVVLNPDGGFDNPAPFTPSGQLTWQDRYPDATVNSWFVRQYDTAGHAWTNLGGAAVAPDGSQNFMKLGQVFAVPLSASNDTAVQFSFDWKPGAGSAGQQLQLMYYLIGWKTNSAPVNTDLFWDFIPWNTPSLNYGVSNLNGNATVYCLDGSAFAGITVTGVAGANSNFTAAFSLPVPTVGDLDFIGIRFNSRGTSVVGHTLDNVILASVPEPSLLALAGTGLLALGLARRRKPAA